MFTLILGDTLALPFIVGSTQLTHDTYCSTHLITVLKRLGLCTSFENGKNQ